MLKTIALPLLLLSLLCSAPSGASELRLAHEADSRAFYSGQVQLKGKFVMLLDETSVQLMGEMVCFIPAAEAKKLVPCENDRRAQWFCFSNQDEARRMLKVPQEEKADSCGFTGTAEILVSDYVVDKREGDVFDQAKLVKVIKQSPIVQLPCD